MPREIALPIACQIQAADRDPALYRLLPDGGADRLLFPLDVTRKPDIDRYQCSHEMPLCDVRGGGTRQAPPIVPAYCKRCRWWHL